MNKQISIIIVTYNSESVIKECLESLDKYNDIEDKVEIIIVDNSPIFNIERFVNDLNLKLDIRLIHNPQNCGFGQGNNIGAKAARGELLFILNPDTILVEPIFKFLLKEFEDEKLTAAGFRLIDRDGNDNDSVGLLPEYNYIYLPRRVLNYLVIHLGLLSKFIFPWGADLIVRKKDFIKAGMFDEAMFLCNEEPDLTHRLNIEKVKIFDKNIVHLEGHTTEVHEVRFKEWLKTTQYYLEKYKNSYKRYLLFFIFRNYSKMILKKLFLKQSYLENNINKILIEEYKRVK
ncbi:glycosyltransferase [Sulfurimonas sp.]|uniref:glycosyltransferase n=1 Tax=Sulfurimonas sp. TaxID=2022749 RepID=UPI0019E68ADF|nr:glycosyltransferase [Sulfurimonas sp.]MBE0514906.1 glycosyltransferase [Sulfurimonas sp.]